MTSSDRGRAPAGRARVLVALLALGRGRLAAEEAARDAELRRRPPPARGGLRPGLAAALGSRRGADDPGREAARGPGRRRPPRGGGAGAARVRRRAAPGAAQRPRGPRREARRGGGDPRGAPASPGVPRDVRELLGFNVFETIGAVDLAVREGGAAGSTLGAGDGFRVEVELGAVDPRAGTIEVKLLSFERGREDRRRRVVYTPGVSLPRGPRERPAAGALRDPRRREPLPPRPVPGRDRERGVGHGRIRRSTRDLGRGDRREVLRRRDRGRRCART